MEEIARLRRAEEEEQEEEQEDAYRGRSGGVVLNYCFGAPEMSMPTKLGPT